MVALFIGGPWDGQRMALRDTPPFYDIAELEDISPGFIDEQASASDPVAFNKIRYELYDNWPVKYLVEGATDR